MYVLLILISQDKRRLLQTWVAEGENRGSCESRVVISRESSNTYTGLRELISIREMVLEKKWPIAKIAGVIARGKGVPDPDAPKCLELIQFWVSTSKTQKEKESFKQRSETEIQAETSSASVGAMMGSVLPVGLQGSVQLTPEQLNEIHASTSLPTPASTGDLLLVMVSHLF